MLKLLKLNSEKERAILGVVICIISSIGGYFLLKFISTKENPPFGHTIYIIMGTSFMAIGGVGIVAIMKYLYDLNKREKRKQIKRKKHKIIFLKKESADKE
ncbi:hypothetical protein [Flavobacterium sp.]